MSPKTLRSASRQLSKLKPRPPLSQPYRCLSCSRRLSQEQPSSQNAPPGTTSFGFESIPESDKQSRVGQVFTSVAPSYDTMNDLMSLTIHRLWKDHFVRSLNPGSGTHPQKILDIASGTGDIALRMLAHATDINNDRATHVTVSDINPAMLAFGRKRLSTTTPYAQEGRLSFLEADAEDLSSAAIPSSSIDLYTVAFGIRNFTRKTQALREAFRVLKPGGVFACLEFSKVRNPLLNAVYKRWSFGAIPLIGQLVAGDRESYQYLVESIERFPDQEEFRGMIQGAGFEIPMFGGGRGWEDLSGGVAAVHKGVKPLG